MATLSRRERSEATRKATEQALVDATLELLGEGTPYAEVGIEQIVKRAGYSRPTFYAYFRDKRELLIKLGGELLDAVAEVADPWLEREEDEVRPALAGILAAFRSHRETLGALVEASTYDPAIADFWRAFHDRFAEIAVRRIAVFDPELSAERARARAFALVWMTERTLTESLGDESIDAEALLDELAGFWDFAAAG